METQSDIVYWREINDNQQRCVSQLKKTQEWILISERIRKRILLRNKRNE